MGQIAPEEGNKMKEKFYTKYLILNTLLLILSLAFWLVISDLYMKCFVLTSLYIFSAVALLRIMCDNKKDAEDFLNKEQGDFRTRELYDFSKEDRKEAFYQEWCKTDVKEIDETYDWDDELEAYTILYQQK